MLTIDRVYQASHTLKNIIRQTELIPAHSLASNCELYLKPENLQHTGSFKLRGAYFKMSTLSDEDKTKGVIACSAGNHAQGVALAAQKIGIQATIFLPMTAPISKIEATEKYGAKVKLVDGVYDDAYKAALEYQKQTGGVFIHPFDDEDVIAGQGTIGLELLEQFSEMEAVVVPVGGGGLISGIAYVIKKLKPSCKVYGVQAQGASSMLKSLNHNECCELSRISTFADGIAVKKPGEKTYEICNEYVDEIVTVSDDEIATAILNLMEKQKLVAEGAGAVAVAAVLFDKLPIKGKKVCAIVSGGNIDVNILSRVINRGLLTSSRLSDLTIQLIDKPGQLKTISAIISNLGANVTGVHYNQGVENTAINGCSLRISMETKNYKHLQEIKQELIHNGYKLNENS